LVGSDPKMYGNVTLEDVKKMGYYAIPFLAMADVHDRACINGSEKGVPSIGSVDLPIPVEVAKGSEQNVKKFLSALMMDDFNAEASIKMRDIHTSVKGKGYPKDLSMLSLSFKNSAELGNNIVLLEKEILEHPDIKAVGIHSTVRPEILLIGDEHGYTLNQMKYHPLSVQKDDGE
jgi:hypothetical protein